MASAASADVDTLDDSAWADDGDIDESFNYEDDEEEDEALLVHDDDDGGAALGEAAGALGSTPYRT